LSIESFENTKPISQLGVYLAKFHPKLNKTKTQLRAWGVQFEAFKGYHFKAYNGLALRLGVNNSDNNIDIYKIFSRFFKTTVRVLVSSLA